MGDVKLIKGFDGYTEGKNVRIALKQVEPQNIVVIKEHKPPQSIEIFDHRKNNEIESLVSNEESIDQEIKAKLDRKEMLAKDFGEEKENENEKEASLAPYNPDQVSFLKKCQYLKKQITLSLIGQCEETVELLNDCSKWTNNVCNPGILKPVSFTIEANIMEMVLDEVFAYKIPLQRVGNYEVAVIDGMMEVTPLEQMALAATKVNKTLRMKTDVDFNYLEEQAYREEIEKKKENENEATEEEGEMIMEKTQVKEEEKYATSTLASTATSEGGVGMELERQGSNLVYNYNYNYIPSTLPSTTLLCEGEIHLLSLGKILRSFGINSQLQLGKAPRIICDKGTMIQKRPVVDSASAMAKILTTMLWKQEEEEYLALEYFAEEEEKEGKGQQMTSSSPPSPLLVKTSSSSVLPFVTDSNTPMGGFLLEGPLGQEYFVVRKILYQIFKRF